MSRSYRAVAASVAWNYRLVRQHLPSPENHEWYAVHEAYYTKTGELYAITERPCTLEGESVEEVNGIRAMMFEAFKHPVLDHENIPGKRRKPRRAVA